MGVKITVHSELGVGTTFTVTLPLNNSPVPTLKKDLS
jgi:signal transduction histidine kinase